MRRPAALRRVTALLRPSQSAAALLAVGALLAVMLPLPGFVVDLLLALNLGAAVGVLLVAITTPEPGRLTSLPAVLVLTSLVRALLCLCACRLILSTAADTPVAGMMGSVGRAVSGGDPLAGIALLVILGVVHLVMVSAGVGRMSEVAARFALDAMPGKQMGLDAAIGRGQLAAAEGREQARRLEQEANYYAAMDGAGRLLRGEAVAVLVMVVLTAIGAGVRAAARGVGIGDLVTQVAVISAGQGVVIILPALLTGAAAALVVSRVSAAGGLLQELGAQMLSSFWPLAAAALALLTLGLVPGIARAPILVAAGTMVVGAWWLARRGGAEMEEELTASAQAAEELTVELGIGLLDLVSGSGHSPLLPALKAVREEVARELGVSLPPLTLRDSVGLRATEYSFGFRGKPLQRGAARPRRLLAVPPRGGVMADAGHPGQVGDGRSGAWVTEDVARSLGTMGYELLAPAAVIAAHLRFTLRRHAAELFDLQAAARLLRRLEGAHPELVTEARAAGLGPSLLRQTCGRLLEAGMPLRDPLSVIEAIAEALPTTQDPEGLALRCRPHLAGLVYARLAPTGLLRAIELAPELHDELESAAHRREDRTVAAVPAQRAAVYVTALEYLAREHGWGEPLVVVCQQRALLPLLDLCRQVHALVVPLAANELPPGIKLEFVATLDPEHLA